MTDKNEQTKLALIQALSQFSGNMISFLNKLNLNPTLKSHCFMNLDQATFWAREAIVHMELNLSTQDTAPTESAAVADALQSEIIQESSTIQ